MASLHMSPQVFAILSALIEERTGIHYPVTDLDLLRDKISPRAIDAGFESLLDYYYFLRYDAESAAEFDKLVEALVVGETYFFREYDQLKVLAQRLVPEALASKPKLRIWSAAAATGEEPLTLAMLLDAQGLLPRVELLATDISQVALERARAGRFGRRSMRQLPDRALADRYLRPEGDVWRVAAGLLDRIQWRQLNLVDARATAALGTFDFILCRNVLIYFRDQTARDVVERLTHSLEPGGALLVSVSESLMRFGTSLNCEEHEGVFIYRKRSPG